LASLFLINLRENDDAGARGDASEAEALRLFTARRELREDIVALQRQATRYECILCVRFA
jgi:hypothetical protein